MEKITSPQNEKIKNIIKLSKARERQKQSLLIIEGARAIKEAIKAGFLLPELYYCPEIIQDNKDKDVFKRKFNLIAVSREIFTKITYSENPDGYLALALPKYLKLDEVKISQNPLVIVLESLEKPGNLGAILRTAYAAKIDLIIINDPKTDIYNPNVIRASEGFVFAKQIVVASRQETYNFLVSNKIKIVASSIKAEKVYTECNLKKGVAVLMGTESTGLSKDWLKLADEQIIIPMNTGIDSLNVSVSTAIIIFEAWRQRGFN